MKMRSVQRGVAKKPVRRCAGDAKLHQAVCRHETALEIHKANIISLSSELQEIRYAEPGRHESMMRWINEAREPLRRGFWGRMRWLLTGT